MATSGQDYSAAVQLADARAVLGRSRIAFHPSQPTPPRSTADRPLSRAERARRPLGPTHVDAPSLEVAAEGASVRNQLRAKALKRERSVNYALRNEFLTKSLAEDRRGSSTRDECYLLKSSIRKLAVKQRVKDCNHRRVSETPTISVRPQDGVACYTGVLRCGSVWACPVCARRILKVRADDVTAVVGGHGIDRVVMVTATARHGQGQPLGVQRKGVANAWRKVQSGKSWRLMRAKYGIEGYVRALEVTNSVKNGWHSHLHILFFLTATLGTEQLELMRAELARRWQEKIVGELGLRAAPRLDEVGLDLRPCNSANYISKLGLEIASASGKVNRADLPGYRSVWKLAADGADGDLYAARCWQEYQREMHGARKLTWSKGLRARYVVEPELTEDEIVRGESQGAEPVVEFTAHTWDKVIRNNGRLIVGLLQAAEGAGTVLEREARVLEVLAAQSRKLAREKWPAKAERQEPLTFNKTNRYPHHVRKPPPIGAPLPPLSEQRWMEMQAAREKPAVPFSWEAMHALFAVYEQHGSSIAAEYRSSADYRSAMGLAEPVTSAARQLEIEQSRGEHGRLRARVN